MVHAILERVKEIAEITTYQEVADLLNTTTVNVYTWKNRKKIPYEQLATFAKTRGISLDWLVFGKGPRYRGLVELSPEDLRTDLTHEEATTIHIPYYEDIYLSAGNGATNGDICPVEYLHLPAHFLGACSRTEAVRVTGDSMQPTIQNGAVVFLRRDKTTIQDGCIYALNIEGEVYLKRLFISPVGILVKSDNPTYPDFTCKPKDLNVLGQLTGVLQKL